MIRVIEPKDIKSEEEFKRKCYYIVIYYSDSLETTRIDTSHVCVSTKCIDISSDITWHYANVLKTKNGILIARVARPSLDEGEDYFCFYNNGNLYSNYMIEADSDEEVTNSFSIEMIENIPDIRIVEISKTCKISKEEYCKLSECLNINQSDAFYIIKYLREKFILGRQK